MDSDHIQRLISRGGNGNSAHSPSIQHDNARRPRKQLRTSRACDFCHNRSIGCRKSPGAIRCTNCNDFDVACSYDRPAKKRGNQNRRHAPRAPRDLSSVEEAGLLLEGTNEPIHGHQQLPLAALLPLSVGNEPNLGNVLPFPLATAHRDLALGEAGMISDLVDVYFEVVYPMYVYYRSSRL